VSCAATGTRRDLPTRVTGLRVAFVAIGVLSLGQPGPLFAGSDGAVAEWIEIDYGALVDRRQLSHSGEPVGLLLNRLGGRSLPPLGQRPDDRALHRLLEPLLEPYAFVLQDALDRREPIADPPRFDVGSLWQPGAPQPAWVELYRARRYLAESDGSGHLRLCLPLTGAARHPADGALPDGASADAARTALDAAWSVVRHLLAAEQRRLGTDGAAPATLELEVYAYVHYPARTTFVLGSRPHRVEVDDTRPRGVRPVLDLDELQAFLDQGLRLEGGRLEPDGSLRLLGSRAAGGSGILGRGPTLADFAVAYRAVSRGGLAEPYMSLDRGFAPQTSIVNYGGRLRDTSLGLVSLLCDIRFKTFSLGLDILRAVDVREEVRRGLPDFRTHYERFAADPRSRDVMTQQTRLWFYPDAVDLTVSLQGDLLAMRRVRMTAAAERVGLGTAEASPAEAPPWTRETVAAINAHYDELVPFFPELADLDQVVRLLSLFTWLRQAEAQGLGVPQLDLLLALELPQLFTPRLFPQLLSYNALPVTPDSGVVAAFDRLPIGAALERLNTDSGRSLPPRRRFARAVAALDPVDSRNATFFNELRRFDLATLDELQLDLLAYRAERLRMHQTVLATPDVGQREQLAERERRGDQLRALSIGIGGLELGMGRALSRAGARSLVLQSGQGALYASTDLNREASPAPDGQPSGAASGKPTDRDAWRVDPRALPPTELPDHGMKRGVRGRVQSGQLGFERLRRKESQWLWIVYGSDSVELRSRKMFLDAADRATVFERVEGVRFLSYELERSERGFVARVLPYTPPPTAPQTPPATLPLGLALMQVRAPDSGGAASPTESPTLLVRLTVSQEGLPRQLEADFPRKVMQHLVLGPESDPAGGRELPGISPPPPMLAGSDTLMLLIEPEQNRPPWIGGWPVLPGEEDAARIARALGLWWQAGATATEPPAPRVVVGVETASSLARWAAAPQVGASSLLLLPDRAFSGLTAGYRDRLARAWGAGPLASALPEALDAELVILVSGEPPGLLARRLRELSRDPRLQGKALAVWGLLAPLRRDLPAALLAEGNLAALGLAPSDVVATRRAVTELQVYGEALRRESSGGQRPELNRAADNGPSCCPDRFSGFTSNEATDSTRRVSRAGSLTELRLRPRVCAAGRLSGRGYVRAWRLAAQACFGSFASSSCFSSPFSYISVRMSQPPMNLPPMNIWGVVGQLVKAQTAGRMFGSVKILRTS